MPLRSVMMKRFIFGFQRRVWCPKCTPLSSNCFMLTTAIAASLFCARSQGPRSSVVAGTGWRSALATCSTTPPALLAGTEVATAPPDAAGGGRAKSTRRDGSHRTAYASAGGDFPRRPGRPQIPTPPLRRGRGSGCSSGADSLPRRRPRARGGARAGARGRRTGGFPGAGHRALVGAGRWRARGDPAVRPTGQPICGRAPGVDLAGPPGSPVLAAGDGVVAFAGMVAGRPLVSIDHADGLRTTYEPVHPSVGAGQAVARGSPVGTLAAGHAGCPSPACLHWGLRRGETYLDPLTLLRPPEVRLLPWA